MGSTTIKFGAGDNRNTNSGMPSFISQMGTEANTTQSSQVTDFGVLEQYLGFRMGDPTNVTRMFNPAMVSQTMGLDQQASAFSKNPASTNQNFFAPALGNQAMQLQRGPGPNLVSSSGVQHDNWGESTMADSDSHTDTSTEMDPDDKNQRFKTGQSAGVIASDSSDKSKEKNLDQKSLRRLAQNREAARKSRMRKKVYVQQLESSRMKLTQLEGELQRARQQGIYISSATDQSHGGSGNGALAFDAEYARWTEEQNRHISMLRTAVTSHVGDTELRTVVDNVTTHYNDVFSLKGNAAKVDVFHILSGMWKTPAERCFMWIGGFRPSKLLKLIANQLEPLTDQQLAGIYNLQQSSQQAEEALSQGMEALQQSLAETLADGSSLGGMTEGSSSGNVANYMGQMAMAMGKLGTLEGFLRQADNLRQQTLQQMHRVLTTRQSARALLLINDYFSRLRALSSLWLARPQE